MLNFFIPCEPPRSTYQSQKRVGVKKNGIPFSYTTGKGIKMQNDFKAFLRPHIPKEQMLGPLRLKVIYRLPLLKAEKKEVKDRGWAYHDKKPDCDNLIKMFQDSMGDLGFWKDDAQVVKLWVTKIRHKMPGIHVILEHEIEEYPEENQDDKS